MLHPVLEEGFNQMDKLLDNRTWPFNHQIQPKVGSFRFLRRFWHATYPQESSFVLADGIHACPSSESSPPGAEGSHCADGPNPAPYRRHWSESWSVLQTSFLVHQ